MNGSADPYTDPKSGVLINRLGISDPEQLRQAEADHSRVRIAELRERPLAGDYDLKHLQGFHQRIFGDVYPWAGDVRSVPMTKGQSMFARPEYIESEGRKVFAALKADNHLKGMDRDHFIDRAAYHLTEVNALHPFREGNGRAQFAMFEQLGREAGHPLDFSRINHQTMILAATLAHNKDYSFLKPVVRSAVEHGQRLEAERQVPPPEQQQQRGGTPSQLDRVTHGLTAALERRALAVALEPGRDGGVYFTHPLGESYHNILAERGWSASAPRASNGDIRVVDAATLPPPNAFDRQLDQIESALQRDEAAIAAKLGQSPDAWRVAYAAVAQVEGIRAQDRQRAEDYLRRAPSSSADQPADRAERALHAALRDAQPLTAHTERVVSTEIRRAIALQLARGETPDAGARLQAGVHLHVAERNLQTALDNRGVGSSGPSNIRPEERRMLAAFAEGAAGRFENLTPKQQDQAKARFVDAGAADKAYALDAGGDVLSRRNADTAARPLSAGEPTQRFAPERLARQLALYDYPRNENPFHSSPLVRAYSEAQELRARGADPAQRSHHSDHTAGYSPGR